MKIGYRIESALLFIFCSYALSTFAAETITGTVKNQTTSKVAAGDEVILLRLESGMEEEARTHTDRQGAFVLPVKAANARHMVRVLHQGVNYDHGVNGQGPLEIAVFDSVAHIQNLQGSIGMAQVESDGRMLKITEMYSIANESVPPVTQASPNNFEIAIAPAASFSSLTVKRNGGVWVNVEPTPIKGQSGRYSVDFPLRPGDTLFKFIYFVPYTGPTTVQVKPAYPIRNFAVMHPPALSFKTSRPEAFTSPGVVKGLKIEKAVGVPAVRDIPAFEISGVGLAAEQTAKSAPPGNPAAPAHNPETSSAVTPSATVGRQENALWSVLTGIAVLLGVSAYAVWKKRKRAA